MVLCECLPTPMTRVLHYRASSIQHDLAVQSTRLTKLMFLIKFVNPQPVQGIKSNTFNSSRSVVLGLEVMIGMISGKLWCEARLKASPARFLERVTFQREHSAALAWKKLLRNGLRPRAEDATFMQSSHVAPVQSRHDSNSLQNVSERRMRYVLAPCKLQLKELQSLIGSTSPTIPRTEQRRCSAIAPIHRPAPSASYMS